MKTDYETVSGHLYLHEDENGDVVDATVFCSDYCHREWCKIEGVTYQGWNGCHEMNAPQFCAYWACQEMIQ